MFHKFVFALLLCMVFATGLSAGARPLFGTPLADDPLQARIYRLDNGLTVAFSVNRETPNIRGCIAFRVGSGDDPADKTGLAHYLEHLLFKGSEKLGTTDYRAERPLLEQIEKLYDRREASRDPDERQELYREIDRLSAQAGQYTVQNEFVQAINEMGGSGLNAYTSLDRTVYFNSLPANQLEKFIRLQFDRFRSPVFRGFHTELETVFEEFNLYQDRPGARFSQLMLSTLFPDHPYGRPVIGLPKDLKNPSPRRVMEFYRRYYVPGNMIIVLAGDFDPDSALRLIEETFGTLPAGEVPESGLPPLEPLRGESVHTLITPEHEMCRAVWRLDRPGLRELDLLELSARILSNGSAGLFDQNLTIPQKVADAAAGAGGKPGVYGMLIVNAVPNRGDSPEQALKLLDAEIEKLKRGDFPDWLLPAIGDHAEFDLARSLRDNEFRADRLLDSYLDRIDWPDAANEPARRKSITKAEIMEFARKHLTGDRIVLYRKNGPLSPGEKLPKPPLTPLKTAKGHSEFFREISRMKVAEIRPEFPDLEHGIRRDELCIEAGLPFEGEQVRVRRRADFEWIPNTRNDYFQLRYVFPVGSRHNRLWQLAGGYSAVAGTETRSAEALKLELYRLAGSVSVSSGPEETVVTINGLARNLPAIAGIAEELLTRPAVNDEALQRMVSRILLARKSQKENPNAVLADGLLPYVRYGREYLEKSNLSSEELNKVRPAEVASLLRELKSYPVRIQYYGPELPELKRTVGELLPLPLPEKRPPLPFVPEEKKIETPAVYLVHIPNVSQLHLLYLTSGRRYNPDDVGTRFLFNSYYGSGMASVTFRKLRESHSLAYGCYSYYGTPDDPAGNHYFVTYLSTQADKLPDAMKAVESMGFPVDLAAIGNSRDTLLKSQAAERWLDERLFSLADNYRKLGLPLNYREETYRQLQDASVFDLLEFYRQEIEDKPRALLVVGDADTIDRKALERFGPVKQLSADDVFPR